MFKLRIEDEEFMKISVRYFMLCNKKSEIKNRIDSKKPLLKSTGGELPDLFPDDFFRKELPQKNEKKEEWSEQKAFSALVEVESSRLKLKEEMGRLIDKTVFFTKIADYRRFDWTERVIITFLFLNHIGWLKRNSDGWDSGRVKVSGILRLFTAERLEESFKILGYLAEGSNLHRRGMILTGMPCRSDSLADFEIGIGEKLRKAVWAGFFRKERKKRKKSGGIGFDKIVLAEEVKRKILEAVALEKGKRAIITRYGLKEVFNSGRGTILLFYGPPGTGKTITAEAVGGLLKRPVINLRIENLLNKYVGESEQ